MAVIHSLISPRVFLSPSNGSANQTLNSCGFSVYSSQCEPWNTHIRRRSLERTKCLRVASLTRIHYCTKCKCVRARVLSFEISCLEHQSVHACFSFFRPVFPVLGKFMDLPAFWEMADMFMQGGEDVLNSLFSFTCQVRKKMDVCIY